MSDSHYTKYTESLDTNDIKKGLEVYHENKEGIDDAYGKGKNFYENN